MKLLGSGHRFHHGDSAHRAHHVGYEGSHVMLPLVGISVMALGLYLGVRNVDFSELGKSALFYIVMQFLDGVTLRTALSAGRLPLNRPRPIVRQHGF